MGLKIEHMKMASRTLYGLMEKPEFKNKVGVLMILYTEDGSTALDGPGGSEKEVGDILGEALKRHREEQPTATGLEHPEKEN